MPHTQRVFDALESLIPEIKKLNAKSLLYVGWRHDCKPWWYDFFCANLSIEKVGVLDIFKRNINDLEIKAWEGRYTIKSYLGDVRKINEIVGKKEYDIIFWDHGPEHVSADDLKVVTPLLAKHSGKMLLYSCPWGFWPQGAEGGNEHEVHRNYVTKEELLDLKMAVTSFGKPDQSNEGELLAWIIND